MRLVTLCLAFSALAVSAVALAAARQRIAPAPEQKLAPQAPRLPVARLLPARYPVQFSAN